MPARRGRVTLDSALRGYWLSIWKCSVMAWWSLSLILLALAMPAYSDDAVWLFIDTRHATATVRQDSAILARYDNISIGQNGTALLHWRGDDTTPLGEYRVISVDRQSRFTIFFGINYPTAAHARLAKAQGKITKADYRRIVSAEGSRAYPPENTPLGGGIGIHGIGRGDLDIHRQYNWTNGCVALDNDQITDLARWIGVGTRVVIR